MFFKKLKDEISKLNDNLEKSNLMELSLVLSNKKEFVKRNLLAGIFRGIGIGVGVTIITAIIIFLLQRIVKLNIPIIGDFIAEIVEIVKSKTNY